MLTLSILTTTWNNDTVFWVFSSLNTYSGIYEEKKGNLESIPLRPLSPESSRQSSFTSLMVLFVDIQVEVSVMYSFTQGLHLLVIFSYYWSLVFFCTSASHTPSNTRTPMLYFCGNLYSACIAASKCCVWLCESVPLWFFNLFPLCFCDDWHFFILVQKNMLSWIVSAIIYFIISSFNYSFWRLIPYSDNSTCQPLNLFFSFP
jgi:hypothetical protein